jgi:hypothetical protein
VDHRVLHRFLVRATLPFPSPNDLASIETLDIYLGWHLRHIEIHEALEFFKEKGGRPIFDPHLEGCDRDLDAFPPTG